ncbi:adenylate/guanylate cyclase domain-containing protein [Mycobacterium sp. NPDC051804]|uniref:adenylate/guanylate cyclase domain-containing protein n=1 Tax=Mycobacterium sp. NPDC051804 TaxID=3364295 RepID=UPI0037BAA75D
MDGIYQWAWDRHGARYSWAICAISSPSVLFSNLFGTFLIVAIEHSEHYAVAAILPTLAAPVLVYVVVLPGIRQARIVERWAAGCDVDRAVALESSYAWTRGATVRAVVANTVCVAVLVVVVGAIAGATDSRLIQYGILGAAVGAATQLAGEHSGTEAAMRPVRVALTGDSDIGDSLPRARPTFAAWAAVLMLALMFLSAVMAAMVATIVDRARETPLVFVVIGSALVLSVGLPLAVGALLSPLLQPIRDLAEGTERVALGDYSQRIPVVQDDDLGVLAASFNRMQAGLAERQRLQSAFGTYVDPALAARLLEQGDDVFTGERREVTVMFVDIRDFTPFAEANPAEDVVARLNALFEIVVPAVVDAGGHVNKFLGDGALAVFGAPNDLADHADAALNAAVLIQRLVAERFTGELRIGVGINSGTVIAGTIGGGSKLEFTLIGDTVNVAARVEQLTKATGDTILITKQAVDALTSRPPRLVDRGSHALKGKSAEVQVFGL